MLRLHEGGGGGPRTLHPLPGRPTTTGLPLRRVLTRTAGAAVIAFAVAAAVLAPASRLRAAPPLADADTTRLVATSSTAAGTLDPAVEPVAATPVATPPVETTLDAASPAVAPPPVVATPNPTPGTTGVPHPGTTVGLVTFRGNPTRTFHGTGPLPRTAAVDWRYPDRAMCSSSTVGEETREWCGTGWTGQPAVVERDGRTWLVFGAYDRAVHFVDAHTGADLIPPFPTGDIIKGSVTVDPDGFPIVWSGSRDGRYRAIAFDGDRPRELWALTAADATGPTRWNDDWDGSGLVIDDRLIVGGENSRLFVVQLNRGYDADGRVTLDPEVLWDAAGFDEQLLADVGDGNVSIEGSVALVDDTVYLANSGGLVQGFDLSPLDRGGAPVRTFRFWMGDDTDATVVADDDGMVYAAAEHERFLPRATEVGQVVKLDPSRPDDPVVWSWHDPRAGSRQVAGVWGTPAIWEDLLIVPTTSGALVGLDRADGSLRWQLDLGDHLWSSPVVVDDVLLQGDCAGTLHAFELDGDLDGDTDVGAPRQRWSLPVGGCIESTPAVWAGRIYVGTRDGHVSAITGPGPDAEEAATHR